jgi:biotin carboxyl carrier protein
LAGKVVSIDIKEGTEVKAGDQIITLEAMKMNTVVSSPVDGTVMAIKVAPGDSVEEGQPLLTIS